MRWIVLFVSALLATPLQASDFAHEIGQTNRVQHSYKTETSRADGLGSSSSRGSSAWLETVIAIDADGTVLEYDIPLEEGEERKPRYWQYPARVRVANDGAITLLNRAEMEQRRDAWLELAELPAEACGEWYFTWNAFQIECDPEDTLAFIASLDWTPDVVEEGALFEMEKTVEAAPLQRIESENGERSYRAEFIVDDYSFREESEEAQRVAVALFGELDNWQEMQPQQQLVEVTGTLEVRLDVDETGHVFRRSEKLITETVTDGKYGEERETRTAHSTWERVPL